MFICCLVYFALVYGFTIYNKKCDFEPSVLNTVDTALIEMENQDLDNGIRYGIEYGTTNMIYNSEYSTCSIHSQFFIKNTLNIVGEDKTDLVIVVFSMETFNVNGSLAFSNAHIISVGSFINALEDSYIHISNCAIMCSNNLIEYFIVAYRAKVNITNTTTYLQPFFSKIIYSTLNIDNSLFIGCGITNSNGGSICATNSTIKGCHAAMRCDGSELIIDSCLFSNLGTVFEYNNVPKDSIIKNSDVKIVNELFVCNNKNDENTLDKIFDDGNNTYTVTKVYVKDKVAIVITVVICALLLIGVSSLVLVMYLARRKKERDEMMLYSSAINIAKSAMPTSNICSPRIQSRQSPQSASI